MTCGCDDPECRALRADAERARATPRICARCYHVIWENVDLGPAYAGWQKRLHLYCHACVKEFADSVSGARARYLADARRAALVRAILSAALLLAVLAFLAIWFRP